MAQLGDLVRAKALLRQRGARLRSEGGRRAREVRRRRGRDRARLARSGLACEGARRGAGDARRARRPGERRACAVSRGPAPAPDRTHRRGRAQRSPSSTPRPSLPRRGPPTSWWSRGSRCGASGRRRRARRSLGPSAQRARHSIPALTAEVESASLVLDTPAARLIASGEERLLLLEEVEALLASNAFVVDACRHVVRDEGKVISLARRPVLFALARALGEAWPGDVPRDTLARARIRIEDGRRIASRAAASRSRTASRVLRALADVSATKRGFALAPRRAARSRGAGAAGRRGACGGARLARRR